MTPALLAVLTPVAIGFGLGYTALGAFLVTVIITGCLMANFLSNAGGAWDNAKKKIEDEGVKGSEQHKAAVIGDTVGDPFKDTSGPALNPLIKVMNLVSLLMLPAIIELRDNDGARAVITASAVAILVIAVAISKRGGANIDTSDADPSTDAGAANLGKALPGHTRSESPELVIAIDRVIVDVEHDTELVERLRVIRNGLSK